MYKKSKEPKQRIRLLTWTIDSNAAKVGRCSYGRNRGEEGSLESKLPVGSFDLLIGRISRHEKHLVGISAGWGRRSTSRLLRRHPPSLPTFLHRLKEPSLQLQQSFSDPPEWTAADLSAENDWEGGGGGGGLNGSRSLGLFVDGSIPRRNVRMGISGIDSVRISLSCEPRRDMRVKGG